MPKSRGTATPMSSVVDSGSPLVISEYTVSPSVGAATVPLVVPCCATPSPGAAAAPLDVPCAAPSVLKVPDGPEALRWPGLEVPTASRTAAPAADVLRCLADQGRMSGQGNSPVAFCGTTR